jgi:serine acetyltransferase
MLERKPLVIGHDVWIGESAILLPSVSRIGNGAVIGAGSVVTKDVEAYTVVAGNPARKIRDRFNRSQVAYLEECKWWELDKGQLVDVISELEAKLQSLRETTRT